MQHKLPVISTEEGGIGDLVSNGESGFLSIREDANDLASHIAALLRDPQLRQKMGTAGYERYKQLFTLEAFEEKISICLKEIIN